MEWKSFCEIFSKEGAVVKSAPMSFALMSLLVAIGVFFVVSWHYDGLVEALREKNSLYESKLEVSSPDEALEKVKTLKENLDLANGAILEIIENKKRALEPVSTAWLEPICVSKNDTTETKRQVLVYNEMGVYLGIKEFSDKTYCERKFPKK